MEIKMTRLWEGENTTLSTLDAFGFIEQYVLEDKDRRLTVDMPLEQIRKIKEPGRTAIPVGRYKVDITYSNRFKRLMPILIGVPGFAGIRIHSGNTHQNTDGCLLLGLMFGLENGDYMVGSSRTATLRLQSHIAAVLAKGEEVWITIESKYQ
ncbi:DUF5675 family protein [Dyadobacter diqingensis]|uniref:DUF5675 family protein n=1 Tax=Dyadobacter diqingensis TaxID=2938121 RepID=UPI0020C26E08|nr:DUF5675 family protein [Dyadobacter diqingensis]